MVANESGHEIGVVGFFLKLTGLMACRKFEDWVQCVSEGNSIIVDIFKDAKTWGLLEHVGG